MRPNRAVGVMTLIICLSGCSGFRVAEVLRESRVIDDFDHIQIGCNLLDFKGKVSYPSNIHTCIFRDNGDMWRFNNDFYEKRDKRGGHYFKRTATLTFAEPSLISDSVLAVRVEDKVSYLEVIDDDNKVTKSFKLTGVTDSQGDTGIISSFIEITDFTSETKKLAGYVAADLKKSKIYIFDSQLKTLSRTINLPLSRVYSVAQISQNTVAALADMHHMGLSPRKDFRIELVEINLLTGAIKPLWLGTSMNVEHFNGQLQYLGDNSYFIFHGVYTEDEVKRRPKSTAEIVNITTGIHRYFDLDKFKVFSGTGKLVKAKLFLKNQRYF